jgi:hypothetical protein
MALRIYANGLDDWRDELLEAFATQVEDLDLGSYKPCTGSTPTRSVNRANASTGG